MTIDASVLSMARRVPATRIVGDTRPIAINLITDTGRTLDLGGAIVTIKIVDAESPNAIIVNESPCVVSGSRVTYMPQPQDVDMAGNYLARFRVETADGSMRVGHLLFEISEDI